MKPVLMTYVRGPLHLIQAEMNWIPEVQMFSDRGDKTVYAYRREEMVYYYDSEMSKKLSEVYDSVAFLFKPNTLEIVGEAKGAVDSPE